MSRRYCRDCVGTGRGSALDPEATCGTCNGRGWLPGVTKAQLRQLLQQIHFEMSVIAWDSPESAEALLVSLCQTYHGPIGEALGVAGGSTVVLA